MGAFSAIVKKVNYANTRKFIQSVNRTMQKTTQCSEQPKLHFKARGKCYARSDIERTPVPDEKVPWEVDCPEYVPVNHNIDKLLGKAGERPPWADPDPITCPEEYGEIKFNQVDGILNRQSHSGSYDIEEYQIADSQGVKVPRNIVGRTGICGRGCLGRWGPNHAADPIVTRWKVTEDGTPVVAEDGKKILQFISVQRSDNKEWAIPGGMVDAGEEVSATIKREFSEEALNSLEATDEERQKISKVVHENLSHGTQVYRGYVDDPRNTDNAWMETVALNCHDEDGQGVGKFKLHAGDDAIGVKWTDISSSLKLYASHRDFIKIVVEKHDAHW